MYCAWGGASSLSSLTVSTWPVAIGCAVLRSANEAPPHAVQMGEDGHFPRHATRKSQHPSFSVIDSATESMLRAVD